MKVLLVCRADFRAPGARQTLRLAEALTAAGEQCMVLVEGDPGTIRFDTDRGSEVEVHRYDFNGPLVDRRTRSLVSRFGPDLVHCYEPRTAPLSASLQLSRREGAALCVRFADDDESLAKEAGGSGLRGRLGLPEAGQIVLYTGSVYRAQYPDLEVLLRAFAELAESNPGALLVHTGRIAPRYGLDQLRSMAGTGADRVHFLGFLEEPADLQALLAEASVLVQPGAPTDFNRLRLPAKVHDYLLAGRPTVTFGGGFGELLHDREDVGVTET